MEFGYAIQKMISDNVVVVCQVSIFFLRFFGMLHMIFEVNAHCDIQLHLVCVNQIG